METPMTGPEAVEAVLDIGLEAVRMTRLRWRVYAVIIAVNAFCVGYVLRGALG